MSLGVNLYKCNCICHLFIFILIFAGDLLDEGKWCSNAEFNYHVNRFKQMFATPAGVETYAVTGNHDVGFHYM